MRHRNCVSAARFTILVRLGVTLLMVGVAVADRAELDSLGKEWG